MTTTFKVGDKVIALDSVRYMVEGETYQVAEVQETVTPFGNLVTYYLHRINTKTNKQYNEAATVVRNGHLLLKRA